MTSQAIRLRHSFGPFLNTENGFVFDVREQAPRLGYNASSMFGVCQHLSAWVKENANSENANSENANSENANPEETKPKNTTPGHQPGSAKAVYQYIEQEIVAQFHDEVDRIATGNRAALERLENDFQSITRTRVSELQCEIQFVNDTDREKFLAALASHSVLVDLPETNAVSFHFNLSYRENSLNEFWKRVQLSMERAAGDDNSPTPVAFEFPNSVEANYNFHSAYVRTKLAMARKGLNDDFQIADWFASQVADLGLSVLQLDTESYLRYRAQILALQSEIYEPARQSPPEEFDALFASKTPIGLLILQSKRIVAMSFVGQLDLFRNERGVPSDPFVDDPTVYYSMDLTVVPEFRGGLGKVVKRAVSLLALTEGVQAIHGRNRDRLARGMWAINLSLGAYELQHLVDDYPDDGKNRDCIYYRCPLHWDLLETDQPCWDKIEETMPFLINGCPKP